MQKQKILLMHYNLHKMLYLDLDIQNNIILQISFYRLLKWNFPLCTWKFYKQTPQSHVFLVEHIQLLFVLELLKKELI